MKFCNVIQFIRQACIHTIRMFIGQVFLAGLELLLLIVDKHYKIVLKKYERLEISCG